LTSAPRPAAFFDVDGTLTSSNIVLVFLSLQRSRLKGFRWWLWLSAFLPKLLYYAVLDMVDRTAFNIAFARNYRGVTIQEIEAWQNGPARVFWKRKVFPQAAKEVQRLKQEGRLIVILSGGAHPFLQPLVQWLGADALYASQPEIVNGVLTGNLVGYPLVNGYKAVVVKDAARSLNLNLQDTSAYADSYSDRFFLEAAGKPVAVNPSRRLRKLAAQRSWPIRRWSG
jgi:HAD superfamily hydrolase (TIGR01490 family)